MRWPRVVMSMVVLGTGFGVAGVVPPAGAAPTVGRVAVGSIGAGAPVTVTAVVTDPDPSGVVLEVIVGFGAVVARPMADDGRSGDGAAGDGVFGARIPGQPADTLVRHRVRSGAAVAPEARNGRTYDGFVVAPRAVTSAAPVLDWRIAPADYQWLVANPGSKEYRPAVLVAGRVVMDGAQVRPQGGLTAQQGPKPNFKFKLPKHVPLGAPYFSDPVDEFVMDGDREDPTYSVNVIANEMAGRHGTPPRQVTTTRIERNGAFHGLYQLIEEMDGEWRDRAGFDVAAQYEGESTRTFLIDEGSIGALSERFSLEHPDDGDHADLAELADALDDGPSEGRPAAIADAMDLPQLVDLLATTTILQNWDVVSGNWMLVRDGDTDRWKVVPNDFDLVLGLRGRTRHRDLVPYLARGTTTPLFSDDRFLQMYHRRVRTLLDSELTASRILGRLDENTAGLGPEIELDRARWGLPIPSLAAGRADVADYVAGRRAFLLDHQRDGELPPPQSRTAAVVISEIRATGDPAGDFVELANPSPTAAVDVSGWSLAGATTATLPPGSVVPAGGHLVIPVDPATIAARGEGIAVAGRLDAQLPDDGGALSLRDVAAGERESLSWSVGGAWPNPGPSGRSIETTSLGADREDPVRWVASSHPGGTPGADGAAGGPLDLDLWTGRFAVVRGTPVEVQISIANRSDAPVSGVEVTSRPGCSRIVGSLAPGQSRSWWCTVTPSSPRSSEAIVARATSAVPADTAHDSAVVVDADTLTLARPRGMAVTMAASGGLRVAYQDPAPLPAGGRPNPFATWRMEAHLAPEGGTTPESRIVPANGTVLRDLDDGVPVSVRVAARSVVSLGSPSVRAPGIAPRASALWPFSSSGELVDALFRDLIDRAPTAGERTMWIAAIDRHGTPPAQLAADLLALPRWRAAVPVAGLYQAALGRAPEPWGLGYWIDAGRDGTTLPAMAEAFAGSTEFRRVYGALGDAAFVDRIYRNILGRAPDAPGAWFWVDRLRSGWTRGRVVLGLTQAAEGRARLDPAAEVAVTWYALAGTAPSAAVRADAVAWRAAGGSMLTLVDSVRSRDAYAARRSSP